MTTNSTSSFESLSQCGSSGLIPDLVARRALIPRSCPSCKSHNARLILTQTGRQIATANWSYRQRALNLTKELLDAPLPLLECESCKLHYAQYSLSDDLNSIIYDSVIDVTAARAHSYATGSLANRMSYASTLLHLLPAGGSVLDFGSGFGPTAKILATVDSIQVVAFDPSIARQHQQSGSRVSVVTSISSAAAHGPYDAVIVDNVLEHLCAPVDAMRQVAGICKPKAIVYISVPDMGSEVIQRQAALLKAGQPAMMSLNLWEHLNYFDVASLDRMMKAAGFLALRQSELPEATHVGLRPSTSAFSRVPNALFSAMRCLMFAVSGDAIRTVNRRFYRLEREV